MHQQRVKKKIRTSVLLLELLSKGIATITTIICCPWLGLKRCKVFCHALLAVCSLGATLNQQERFNPWKFIRHGASKWSERSKWNTQADPAIKMGKFRKKEKTVQCSSVFFFKYKILGQPSCNLVPSKCSKGKVLSSLTTAFCMMRFVQHLLAWEKFSLSFFKR